MRIVIDMQGAQTESRFRGIGRYTLSLAQAIVRNRGEHEIMLALSGFFPDTIEPIRAAFDGLLPQENIRVWYAPGPVRERVPRNKWRREAAELVREAFLASIKPDVVHVSSLIEGYMDDAVTSIGRFDTTTPVSVSLYDLIPLLNPAHYLDPDPAYAQYYHRKIEHLRRASLMLAISESSRQEGLAQLGVPDGRVVNISTAADAHFHQLSVSESQARQLREKFGLTRPFVLCTGGADERKNLPRLMRAYARLLPAVREKHQLVLAGKISEGELFRLQAEAKSVGLHPNELRFTGYVTDEELVCLYNLCKLFVFPSWHEGFGLPALEAMSCGAAVIGANTSSVPEVIGREDAMFDPYDETAIGQKLTEVLGNDAFRAELAEHGLEQAKKFSWDESARRAIAAFERFYSGQSATPEGGKPENLLPRLIQAIAKVVPTDITDVELLNMAHLLSCIQSVESPKQLFVDISELAQQDVKTGVQRVTRSILKELLLTPPKGYVVEPVYAMPGNHGYRYARRFTGNFRGAVCNQDDELIDYHPGDIFLGLDLNHHVVTAQTGYLALMREQGVQVYFVVYDLLPVLRPDAFLLGAGIGHKLWLDAIMGFDGALCISRSVADELAEWQRVHGPKRLRPFKIGWFHLGADIENSVPTRGLPVGAKQVLQEFACRPTFLTVGTIEPRKGQQQVVDGFEVLWEQGVDVNLVIVGKQGWMVDSLVERIRSHIELNKRLFWLEGISDEYLDKVYAASACLIAASAGEGFGLPLIEAAQHKLPIIARDIPVFREVAGVHAFYFSGQEPIQLANAIKEWMALDTAGAAPKSRDMPWLTWHESAQRLVEWLV